MITKFNSLANAKSEELLNFLDSDFTNKYIDHLLGIYKLEPDSPAINDIIQNKEKIYITSYAEKFKTKCQNEIISIMQEAGISQGKSITLCNKIMLDVGLPQFTPLELYITPIQIDEELPIYSKEKNDNGISANYITCAILLGITVAGIYAPLPIPVKSAMIVGGIAGTAITIKEILHKKRTYRNVSSKTPVKSINADSAVKCEAELIQSAEKNLNILKNWSGNIFKKAKEIVGCEI